MKLQRIVSQSPAEDFETLTAEPPQRNRQEPVASASTDRAPRPPRKFSRDEEKPAGRYAGKEFGEQQFWMLRIGTFLRLLFISLFLFLRFGCFV
jgi:hypothetical protein